MQFRKSQISDFIIETTRVSKLIGLTANDEGNLVQEDEYISNVVSEVDENLIDLTAARASIINFLNHQIDKKNGAIFNQMKEEFLKINNWVRNIEIEVNGKPSFDETISNPDTGEPNVEPSVIQDIQDHYPPGFKTFTGEQEAAILEVETKVESNTDYDPFIKDPDQTEAEWEKRFLAKETEAVIYLLASYVANNNPLFNRELVTLLDLIIYKKNSTLINENFIRRINELIEEDNVSDLDLATTRLTLLVIAANLFSKEFLTSKVSYNDRKLLTLNIEEVGSNLTFKPSNMEESIQYILLNMFALRPLSEISFEVLKEFLTLNQENEDFAHLMEALNKASRMYVEKGFLTTGETLATMLNKLCLVDENVS